MFDIVFHGPSNIGGPDNLYWHKKKTNLVFPIRIMPREEILITKLGCWNDKVKRPVQYINYPHLQTKNSMGEKVYVTVKIADLIPYYGQEQCRESWCPTLIKKIHNTIEKETQEC